MNLPYYSVLAALLQSLDSTVNDEGDVVSIEPVQNNTSLPMGEAISTNSLVLDGSLVDTSPGIPTAPIDHLHGQIEVTNLNAEIPFGALSLPEFEDPLKDPRENEAVAGPIEFVDPPQDPRENAAVAAPSALLSPFSHLVHIPAAVHQPASLPCSAPAERAVSSTSPTSSSALSVNKPLHPPFPTAILVAPAAARTRSALPPPEIPVIRTAAEYARVADDNGKGVKDGFLCELCPANFSHRHKLKTHYRKHTGECPYKCTEPGCRKEYPWHSSMQQHALTHQREREAAAKGAGIGSGVVGGVRK